ncbi:MAG: tetratricopeptide repeat protein [Dysgonamonadaceae bacterium]|nr:tetratricopeptide repeat protein [Dysgonamonadaceae bacterium]
MKRFRLLPLFLLSILVSLVSCKSSYLVPIEIQKPGALVIPGKVEGVLVVNNAAPQSGDNIVYLKINQKDSDVKIEIETDTTLWSAVVATANAISEANFFEKTSLFEESLRDDDEWLAVKRLSEEKCDSLYKESGCNVIVSIDRLVFSMKYAIVNNINNTVYGPDESFLYIKCHGLLSSSIYLDNKKARLTSFNINDSITVHTDILGDSVKIFQGFPLFIVRELTKIMAQNLASYLVPSWEFAERIVYTSTNADMLKADKLFAEKNWKEARTVWESLFYRKERNKDIDKARMAINIGTAYEMDDNLIMAVYWVQKAKNIYDLIDEPENMKSKIENERLKAAEYLTALNVRIHNNKILDIQYD